MGPEDGDELNLIEQDANHGWPEASNGSDYGGGEIPDHAPSDGFVVPQASWTPSISPGSLLVYSGDLFPDWKGDAFIGALSGEALVRVDLDGTAAGEPQAFEMGERIRTTSRGRTGRSGCWRTREAARCCVSPRPPVEGTAAAEENRPRVNDSGPVRWCGENYFTASRASTMPSPA